MNPKHENTWVPLKEKYRWDSVKWFLGEVSLNCSLRKNIALVNLFGLKLNLEIKIVWELQWYFKVIGHFLTPMGFRECFVALQQKERYLTFVARVL